MKQQVLLHELRESIGLTQKEFSKIINVSDKTLWGYEQDSSNIPNKVLSTVLYLFEISYDDIFLGSKYDLIVQRRRKVLEKLKNEGGKENESSTGSKRNV